MKDLKKILGNKTTTIGSWITLPDLNIVEMMAKSNFDWLAIDLEHSVIDLETLQSMIRIIELCNVFPLVRLTSNDPNQIKRVMDAGAMGIIVPMVKSVADVKRSIEAVHYPPKGTRSVGLARAQDYGRGLTRYIKRLKQKSVIVVQIEHIDAVEDLDNIFSISEVDAYIVGPNDLSASMGLPGQIHHPKVKKMISHIHKTAEEKDLPGGQHIIEPDLRLLRNAEKKGSKFIGYSLDIRLFDKALVEFESRNKN